MFEVHRIIDPKHSVILYGKQFEIYTSFYEYPLKSDSLNIRIVQSLSTNLYAYSIKSVLGKCMLFTIENKENAYVSFPLIHSMDA